MFKKIVATGLLLAMATPALAAGLTITLADGYPIVTGNKKEAVVTITFDTSYPTGGESLAAAAIGFSKIDYVSAAVDTARTRLVSSMYDYTNSLLKLYYTAAYDSVYAATTRATVATEIGSTWNASTWTAKFFIVGN